MLDVHFPTLTGVGLSFADIPRQKSPKASHRTTRARAARSKSSQDHIPSLARTPVISDPLCSEDLLITGLVFISLGGLPTAPVAKYSLGKQLAGANAFVAKLTRPATFSAAKP